MDKFLAIKALFESETTQHGAVNLQHGETEGTINFNRGTANYNISSEDDPHIKEVISKFNELLHKEYSKHPDGELDGVGTLATEFFNNNNFHGIIDLLDKIHEKEPEYGITQLQNKWETAAFNIIDKAAQSKKGSPERKAFDRLVEETGCPKFNKWVFNKLILILKAHNKLFKSMTDLHNNKTLRNPRFYTVPVPPAVIKHNKYPSSVNTVDTAAAYGSGDFVFNEHFMQALMLFAHIKNVKPKHSFYTNNSVGNKTGTIPPQYCYIAFVIAHEILHYCLGDFSIGNELAKEPDVVELRRKFRDAHPTKKVIPYSTISNYAGDLRMNHMLVKNGYEQLPMGLFSENFNADTHKTYKELIKDMVKVLYSLDDLIDNDVNNHDNHTGGENNNNEGGGEGGGGGYDPSVDDLGDNPEKPENNNGEGEGENNGENQSGNNNQQGKSGKSGKSGQKDENGQENGQDGQDGKSGQEDGQENGAGGDENDSENNGKDGKDESNNNNKNPESKIDEIWKQGTNQLNDRDDGITSVDDIEKNNNNTPRNNGKGKGGGGGGGMANASSNDESFWKTLKPSLNWHSIVDKMFSNAMRSSTSYSRLHNSTMAAAALAMSKNDTDTMIQVKPANRDEEYHNPKILFVVDESGSMGSFRERIAAEIAAQFKSTGTSPRALLLKYGNNHITFNCNFSTNKAQLVTDSAELNRILTAQEIPEPKTSGANSTVELALNTTFAGGSTLGDDEIRIISNAYKNGYNILIFTDTDILAQNNLDKVKFLYHKLAKNRFYIVATTLSDFREICEQLEARHPENITFLSPKEEHDGS